MQAAITAGLATATATNPIWVIKTRLQLDRSASPSQSMPRQYQNSLDCIRQVLRQEGIKGLYRGLSASYLGTVETALHLVLYERLKAVYTQAACVNQESVTRGEFASWVSTSSAAGSAKLIATLITYPHEVSPLLLNLFI